MSDSTPPENRTIRHVPSGLPSTNDEAGPKSTADAARDVHTHDSLSLPPGYEFVDRLGRGGMGVVYRVRQVRANRDVAIKMILAGEYAETRERERFRTEAEAVASLSHAHIVAVYEVGEHARRPFFSMELCPGGSLSAKLAGMPLPPREAATLIEKLARGVAAAHAAGVIHRDLKPANVLLTADGEPKITDFGLAKLVGSDEGLTATGAVMGTPSYMAPEQAFGESKRVGSTADVYALGAVLYECLTGRPPFRGVTTADTLDQVRNQDPVNPRSLDGSIPRDLETICLKCLAKDPHRRYPTAAEFADDLGHYLAGRPIAARPVSGVERAWKSIRRNREISIGVATAFLVLALGTAVSTWQAIRARAAETDKQRQLAESFLQQAHLQMQRGQWQDALASLDRALGEGHPDPIAVRVLKVRVYFALNQTEKAQAELSGLETPDGMAELLRADLLLGTDNVSALRHARAALARGLPDAERAYVAGLIATDAAQAEAGFRQAVALEPFHLRANQLLGWVQIMQGKTDEALKHVTHGRAFFPEDPNLGSLELLALAAQGRRREAEAAFRNTARELRAENRKVFWAVARLLLDLHNLEEVLTMPEWELMLKVGRCFSEPPPELGPAPVDRPLGRFVFPPFLEQAFAPFGNLFANSSVADMLAVGQRLSQDPTALTRVTEALDESTLLLLRGKLLVDQGQYRKALPLLTRSLAVPGLFATRRVTLTILCLTEWQLAAQSQGAEQKSWLAAAKRHLRELFDSGGTPRYYTEDVIRAAFDCQEFELARRMAADRETWTPSESSAILQRAHLERISGNHAGAIERFEKLRKSFLSAQVKAEVENGLHLSQAMVRELASRQPPPAELAPLPRLSKRGQ